MVSLLCMEDKNNWSQDLVHALPVAQIRFLLAVDEQHVQHRLSEKEGDEERREVSTCEDIE